jgi:hypothetical protein
MTDDMKQTPFVINISISSDTGREVVVRQEIESITWPPLLEAFCDALLGAGFVGVKEKIAINASWGEDVEWVPMRDYNTYE